jgi:hypothetical protein
LYWIWLPAGTEIWLERLDALSRSRFELVTRSQVTGLLTSDSEKTSKAASLRLSSNLAPTFRQCEDTTAFLAQKSLKSGQNFTKKPSTKPLENYKNRAKMAHK